MSRKDENKLIVGLDIGTSKVLAIVGEVSDDNEVEIIGYGHHPSTGMSRGVVANIEETVTAIQRAVEEAELMAGCQIYSVYAGIAGAHINSFNSHGMAAVRDSEVDQNDIDRAIDSATAVMIPNDQSIIHTLPQEYIIDGQQGIRSPIGMNGIRLEVNLHMVTASVITNDIAIALRTPTESAEEIKKKYGCALRQLAAVEESIEVKTVGDRPPRKLSKQTLSEVVEPRVEELFDLVRTDLRRNGCEHLIRSGVVLTGGSSKMEGMIELAEEIFHLPVRLGVPKYIGGLKEVVKNPIYSTGVGLVQFGHTDQGNSKIKTKTESRTSVIWQRIKHWFQGNF